MLKTCPHCGHALPLPLLTQRQIDVLRLIADGKNNTQIAEALVISRQTVKKHISDIRKRLNARNRIQMIRTGITLGLINIEEPPCAPG